MMPINKYTGYLVSIFVLILSLSSCSQFNTTVQDDLTAEVDSWIANNEYGKALEAIHYVHAEDPKYLELKNRQGSVLELAHEYEKNISETTQKMVANKQWASALKLVDQASRNFPEGLLIQETAEKLAQQQSEQIEKLEQDLLIKRGEWMQEALPLYQALLDTDPKNKQLQTYLVQLEYEAELLAEQISLLAEAAIDRKHYKTARLHLVMANNLSPEAPREELLNQINQINKQNSQIVQNKKVAREKREEEKKETQHQQALFDNIERAFSSGWLSITRSLIGQLDEEEQQSPDMVELKQNIEQTIEDQVGLLFSQADKLYEDGQFEQAIEKWQKILTYEPDNELAREHIQRTEKVIDKLNQLREKQL